MCQVTSMMPLQLFSPSAADSENTAACPAFIWLRSQQLMPVQAKALTERITKKMAYARILSLPGTVLPAH
jgi:hypothetical protein